MWFAAIKDWKLQLLLILNKMIFATEITVSLFVSGQYLDSPHAEKIPDNSKAGEQTGFVSIWSTLLLTAFLANPGIWQWVFPLISSSYLFYPVKRLRFYYRSTLRLSPFWLRPCSECEYWFGTLAWFWNQAVSVESVLAFNPLPFGTKAVTSGTNCLWPSPSKTGDVSLELCWFGPQPNSFGNKSSFWSGS